MRSPFRLSKGWQVASHASGALKALTISMSWRSGPRQLEETASLPAGQRKAAPQLTCEGSVSDQWFLPPLLPTSMVHRIISCNMTVSDPHLHALIKLESTQHGSLSSGNRMCLRHANNFQNLVITHAHYLLCSTVFTTVASFPNRRSGAFDLFTKTLCRHNVILASASFRKPNSWGETFRELPRCTSRSTVIGITSIESIVL